jgi:hypothetical protein
MDSKPEVDTTPKFFAISMSNPVAHNCQYSGTHFYGNDGTCVFCGEHRDPVAR